MNSNDDYVQQLFRKLGLSDFGARTARFLLERPLTILLILVVAVFVSRFLARLTRRTIEALVTRSTIHGVSPHAAVRARTLAGVAASVVRIIVWTIAMLLVLGRLDINLGPFLAGASIVGVALGFGAQSLVKDFLSGFFILAEDQFGVGDVVTVLDTTGTVEQVNLRVTRLRGTDGTVWFVPNGEIRKVGNAAKDWSRAIVDVVIPPGADVAAARAAIADELERLAADSGWAEGVLDPPEVVGVEDVGPDGATVRVAARTMPEQRARVARDIRAKVGERLRAEGILVAPAPSPASAVPPAPPATSSRPPGTDAGS